MARARSALVELSDAARRAVDVERDVVEVLFERYVEVDDARVCAHSLLRGTKHVRPERVHRPRYSHRLRLEPRALRDVRDINTNKNNKQKVKGQTLKYSLDARAAEGLVALAAQYGGRLRPVAVDLTSPP